MTRIRWGKHQSGEYGHGRGGDLAPRTSTRRQMGTTCGLDLKYVPLGTGIHDGWGRAFCGESCRVAYQEIHHFGGRHYVPDPRFHRAGDGWRKVTRWIRAALPMRHRHQQHPRRDRRGQAKPR